MGKPKPGIFHVLESSFKNIEIQAEYLYTKKVQMVFHCSFYLFFSKVKHLSNPKQISEVVLSLFLKHLKDLYNYSMLETEVGAYLYITGKFLK